MYIGTRCSDDVLVTPGAATIVGMAAGAGAMGAGRTAEVAIVADGFDDPTRVGVDDERLGVVDVMESEGSGIVGADAGSGADGVALRLAEPPSPAQPATTIERAAAPARERAAYQRACLTPTHASE
ncbi:MAG: hypothetical protein HHJ11_12465 [Phycicoccus sp.]|nr:hypothetical protein [Phycicoccus sp.]NMM35608.1 hypothetical protein [Phycicoccus sp.]